jgi:hypothetical protein
LIRDQAISASRTGGSSRFSCAPTCSSLVVTSSAPHLRPELLFVLRWQRPHVPETPPILHQKHCRSAAGSGKDAGKLGGLPLAGLLVRKDAGKLGGLPLAGLLVRIRSACCCCCPYLLLKYPYINE